MIEKRTHIFTTPASIGVGMVTFGEPRSRLAGAFGVPTTVSSIGLGDTSNRRPLIE